MAWDAGFLYCAYNYKCIKNSVKHGHYYLPWISFINYKTIITFHIIEKYNYIEKNFTRPLWWIQKKQRQFQKATKLFKNIVIGLLHFLNDCN